ncbi:Biotin transporter BioY [Caloramator mitchellensis]|uniref:Biotin transporter n=1 Tax=Caloramator mitchellensis TaxID=908809 RepID=A0A0R3JWB3_CALMK|nr:biotin transporter BioY [Caloramator mitchellensis]KRQ87862.1 Biotin transporter BioY [Caloramator mitchellensis]
MNIRKMTKIALFAALISVLSLVSIPIGTVPITLQTFAILLTGIVLGPTDGGLAVLTYILLGSIGLPVFAGGKAGFQVIFGPTGGYILSFPIAAYTAGMAIKQYNSIKQAVIIICSILVVYLIGVPYLKLMTGMDIYKALKIGLIPFIIPDMIKAFIALYLGKIIKRRVAMG